jgi:predicted phage terminase large subunit-like protein
MGHNPDLANLMSSHSGYMTRMFYDAVLNIIQSKEYCWQDVFPAVNFESTNAKEETINLGKFKPFKTLTCRPIRASLTGVTRCSGYLYCDDLVSGIEEALSKERLDKLYGEYTTDLKSRKKLSAKEIHIATRWSVHDVIGRLERQYGDGGKSLFLSVPDIDPKTNKSNFNYTYGVGFDEEYFNDMAATMDEVSYRCLFKSDPIEREGLLYHSDELMRYLGGLPAKEPDAILAVCDTKDTGTDYNFLGVFYQYKDIYYLEDVVFKNISPGVLDQLNSDMLVKHKVQECQFESNKEGSRTANEVERLVIEKGGRCHITKKYTTTNKETRIIVNSSWVKTHIYFKDPTEYDIKSDYGVMMAQLCSYTQVGKNIHDDAADGVAMFSLFVDQLYGHQIEVVSRADLGF